MLLTSKFLCSFVYSFYITSGLNLLWLLLRRGLILACLLLISVANHPILFLVQLWIQKLLNQTGKFIYWNLFVVNIFMFKFNELHLEFANACLYTLWDNFFVLQPVIVVCLLTVLDCWVFMLLSKICSFVTKKHFCFFVYGIAIFCVWNNHVCFLCMVYM